MKKLIKLSKIFTPFIYRLLIFAVAPVVFTLAGLWLMKGYGMLGYMLALLFDAEVLMVADIGVFNGVCSKTARYRLLMSSEDGRKVLGGGLWTDNLLRFLQMSVVSILCFCLSRVVLTEDRIDPVCMIVMTALSFGLSTLGLVFLRYISTVSIYGPTLTLVSFVIVGILLCVYFLFQSGIVENSVSAAVALTVVSLGITALGVFCSVRNVLRRYDRSFTS